MRRGLSSLVLSPLHLRSLSISYVAVSEFMNLILTNLYYFSMTNSIQNLVKIQPFSLFSVMGLLLGQDWLDWVK